jgi:hypothetical protein
MSDFRLVSTNSAKGKITALIAVTAGEPYNRPSFNNLFTLYELHANLFGKPNLLPRLTRGNSAEIVSCKRP